MGMLQANGDVCTDLGESNQLCAMQTCVYKSTIWLPWY